MMSTTVVHPTVWGVFVGEHGNELEALNSKSGPFPPKSSTEGYVAIGWADVGNMWMYKDDYNDFVKKFRICWPSYKTESAFKTAANMVWNFAFEIKIGDYIISPSSASKYLLIGEVIGDYQSDHGSWAKVAQVNTRADLMHLRRVKWRYAFPETDPRYEKLHRIGQLTVCQPDITVAKLLGIAANEQPIP